MGNAEYMGDVMEGEDAIVASMRRFANDAKCVEHLSTDEDPVAAHFNAAFGSLQGVDLAAVKGDAKGSLAECVAFAQQAKDLEFQQSFMVTGSEAAEVKALAGAAKVGNGYDFSKLAPDAAERLDALYA